MRVISRADRLEQRKYHEFKKAQNRELQLTALAEKGALAQERFDSYANGRLVTSARNLQAELQRQESEKVSLTETAKYLREQIEIFVYAFGWTDVACPLTATSKESAADLVKRLSSHLLHKILHGFEDRRRRGEVPTEAVMPDLVARTEKQLGTPTEDTTRLMQATFCSRETFQKAVEQERQRREDAGFTDSVQLVMPSKPPELTSKLVGYRLEICWGRYRSTEDGSLLKMWCPCFIERVADGETDKGADGKPLSDNARKLAPRGMVLVRWEADPDRGEKESTSMWMLLDPRKWNGEGHRAWRYHPSQLARMRAPKRRAPSADCCRAA
ncbi:hypothetical protein AB1Y20_009796 [Prymnesium parvum]|uniref:Uncharacterized protein n=1 Tax=Prymnesium parvum TaxID=97485 RepID=A0AB34K2M3_PRYPA